MIQKNELFMLLLGGGVFIFVLKNRLMLSRLPAFGILISGFCVIFAGWILTVVETFFWKGFFNYLEHICYAVSSVLTAVWCLNVFKGEKEAE